MPATSLISWALSGAARNADGTSSIDTLASRAKTAAQASMEIRGFARRDGVATLGSIVMSIVLGNSIGPQSALRMPVVSISVRPDGKRARS